MDTNERVKGSRTCLGVDGKRLLREADKFYVWFKLRLMEKKFAPRVQGLLNDKEEKEERIQDNQHLTSSLYLSHGPLPSTDMGPSMISLMTTSPLTPL